MSRHVDLVDGCETALEPTDHAAVPRRDLLRLGGAAALGMAGVVFASAATAQPAGATSGLTSTNELIVDDLRIAGLPGAITGLRFVGATASGAPLTGTFLAGDVVVDLTGVIWVCLAGGSPGSWRACTTGGQEAAYAETTFNQSTSSTGVAFDVLGLAVPVLVGSRPIIVEFGGDIGADGGNTWHPVVSVFEGTTLISQGTILAGGTGQQSIVLRRRLTPTTGSHTYKVRLASSAAGKSTMYATSTSPAWLQVTEV
jgi:hypothetical protein